MRRVGLTLIGLIAGLLLAAKLILRDHSADDHNEIDLAAVMASRHLRIKARPFIGGTLLLIASQVELDLRRALPAPTGIEVDVVVIGSSLRLVVPPYWRVNVEIERRGSAIAPPPADESVGSIDDDAPVLNLTGSAWFSSVVIETRTAPTAVAG